MTTEQKMRVLDAVKEIGETCGRLLEIVKELEDKEQLDLFDQANTIIETNCKIYNLVK